MALFIPQVARGSHRINWETVEKCDFEAMLRNQDLETLESFLIILQKYRNVVNLGVVWRRKTTRIRSFLSTS